MGYLGKFAGISLGAYVGRLGAVTPPDDGSYDSSLEDLAWTVAALGADLTSSLSTERHRFAVAVSRGEHALDAADYALQVAYYTDRSIAAASLVWHDLAWDEDGNAYVLVGPDANAALYLAPGAYYRVVRTKSRPHAVTPLPVLIVDAPAGA